MRCRFIPLDYDYTSPREGSSIVRIFGRTDKGKRICVIDSMRQFFYIIPRPKTDLRKFSEKVKKAEFEHSSRTVRIPEVKIVTKSFMGREMEMLQVFLNNPQDINSVKDGLREFKEIDHKKEMDINFITRYIIEKDVKPLIWHDVEGSEVNGLEYGDLDVDIILEAQKITPSDNQTEFKPRILAFDIETTEFELGKGEIIMLSLADDKVQKVFTWKKFKDPPKEVEFVKDEAELIERFISFVEEYKPDVLTGYFSDGFDLPYIRARADLHGIKLNLGVDGSNVSFIRGGLPSCEIRGIVHVDLFKFVDNIISPNLQSETISLNDVAKELIGEEKVKVDLSKITKEMRDGTSKEEELRKFSLYSLQDSVLTAKLFEKMWHNISELTKTVSEPLFDVSRSSYSTLVEDNIIHHLKRFNEVAETRPIREDIESRRMRPRYTGAFVKEPEAGIYDDVAVFDFRSFYPNVIVSFNISAPTITEKHERGDYETPEFEFEGEKRKFYFQKEKGFIPRILNELLDKRKEVKARLKKERSPVLEAEDYALKTLLNASYGYFGFFGARYYSLESAASITAICRYYIHRTIEDIEKSGFNVIYSDTDSIMFNLEDKKEKDALEVLEKINKSLPGTMELELERFYKRGIFVMKKTGEGGAKKKYALLSKDGTLKIRGFESVRRDKCDLSRELQEFVLKETLDEGKADRALKHVKKTIEDVKNKAIPTDRLVIRTQLTKPIEEYVAIGPHVAVAKRMREKGMPIKEGGLIEYVIASGTEKLIRERARMPDEVKEGGYDSEYYINNQIIPAIEGIFNVFGISTEDLRIGKKKQKSLGEFK